MASWTEFKKIVYERVEVSSFRKQVKQPPLKPPRALKILGMRVLLGGNLFSISDRLVSETRLKSVDREDAGSEVRMLRGLSATGFEGVFTASYEPFNYEVRLSAVSSSPKELNTMVLRMRASVSAGFPGAELETLKASPEVALWSLGGLPVSRLGNALILLRGKNVSAASLMFMKLKDSLLNLLEEGLEGSLRSSAESGCSLRFCIPVKSCSGVMHALSLWAKRRSVSSQYSKAYKRLRENGIFNDRSMMVGSDLKESAKLESLRLQYEKLNSQSGCWTCSPVIIVLGPPAKNHEQAYAEQRKYVEAVKASFSSSYGVKLEEAGWLSLGEAARTILARRIIDSKRLHLTSEELSLFVNLPKPLMPSISYTPRRRVEFEAFNPAELQRNGIFLGYYESMGRKLEVRIGVNDLPLHIAVFGVPGSGKTTLVKSLLRKYVRLGGAAMVFDRHGEYIDELDDALTLSPENTRVNLLEHGIT